MSIRLILSSIALAAASTVAAAGQRTSPAEAAKAFTLDSVAPAASPDAAPDAAPAMPAAEASPAVAPTPGAPALASGTTITPPAAASTVVASPAPRAVFTLDTPIQDLIADPATKAVLDKDLPGMSDDENLDKFKMLSLRSLQPQTGGQLTDAMLAKVAADLDVLGGGSGAMPTAPIKAGNSRRNQDGSR